jgi:hypothetical protein
MRDVVVITLGLMLFEGLGILAIYAAARMARIAEASLRKAASSADIIGLTLAFLTLPISPLASANEEGASLGLWLLATGIYFAIWTWAVAKRFQTGLGKAIWAAAIECAIFWLPMYHLARWLAGKLLS